MNMNEQIRAYERPILRQVEPDEAMQFLIDHARTGDRGAQEILALDLPILAGSEIDSAPDVGCHLNGEEPGA